MAITAQQYVGMRALFRSALAANSFLVANPSDGEVLSFFSQLSAEAAGSAALSVTQQAAIGYAFRGLLSGNFPGVANPTDAQVVDFWTQLATDASGAPALAVPRYQTLKQSLLSRLALNYPGTTNPTLAQLLGYLAVYLGPTGTDYGALAIANGLTVVGYFRADYGLSGSAGTGLASWAPIAGSMSAITPDGTATNGIGSATAGLGGRAGLILDGATQMGQYTAPALAAPGTTNFHRYIICRQASPVPGGIRKVMADAGDAYKLEFSSSVNLAAYGCGVAANIVADVWQRWRISYTGSGTSEIKWGNGAATSGGAATNTAPGTARTFGSLTSTQEVLMYLELQGTKANFLTFDGLANTAIQTDWGSIQV